jgi:deazaflavin-dependent oxidoreductase (nitroreductase family)
MTTPDPNLANQPYCYLTTTGRVTGKPHTIEIWFALEGNTLYMLSGGGAKSDWVRNIQHSSNVSIRIGEATFAGEAKVVSPSEPNDATARRLLYEKYNPSYSGDLISWRDSALPVAVNLKLD